MHTPPYSFHCFLFPFKWEHLFAHSNDPNDSRTFEDRVNLDRLEEKLGIGSGVKSKWKRKRFSVDKALHYNEYNYFYDFVRDVIYDRGDSQYQDSGLEGKSLVRHYEYCLPESPDENSYYEIVSQEETYKLKIKKIFLDIYETGVGILSYHLLNYSYPEPEDILNINQYGRRAFVGGFRLDKYPSKGISPGGEKFVDLAKSLTLRFADGSIIREDFKASVDFNNYQRSPFILPVIITELLAGKNHDTILTTNWDIEQGRENYIWLSPSIDDRMFVVSWYCCDVSSYTEKIELKNSAVTTTYDYEDFIKNSEFWFKYIYTDSDKGESHQNPLMRGQLATAATYDRWLNYGTLYGISRYSFIMFCVDHEYTPDFTLAVFETMYLKMVELSLVQRATVLRFSDEVQHISSMKRESLKTDQIRGLYTYYIRFVNKIDFREITPQEQGIELYDKIQKAMRVETQIEYLDKEINQLHDYALLLEERKRGEEAEKRLNEEQKRTEKLDLITYFGVPIAVITLILSVIGFIKDVKLKIDEPDSYPIQLTVQVILAEIVLVILLIFQVNKMVAEQGIKFNLSRKVIYIILLLIGIIITPFLRTFIFNLNIP